MAKYLDMTAHHEVTLDELLGKTKKPVEKPPNEADKKSEVSTEKDKPKK